MSVRLDDLLVLKGFAKTRSQAKSLVLAGRVFCNGKKMDKGGKAIARDVELSLLGNENYVGRGGFKLAGALDGFCGVGPGGSGSGGICPDDVEPGVFDVTDLVVLDIGSSTGGFTDCLLQRGVRKVYAVDVGVGQLAEDLVDNEHVVSMEGVDIRDLEKLPELVDLIVIDVSYISLRLIFGGKSGDASLRRFLKPAGQIIALFKPQFEAGPEVVGRDGVIKNEEVVRNLLLDFQLWLAEEGFYLQQELPSSVTGKKGNQEYFLLVS